MTVTFCPSPNMGIADAITGGATAAEAGGLMGAGCCVGGAEAIGMLGAGAGSGAGAAACGVETGGAAGTGLAVSG